MDTTKILIIGVVIVVLGGVGWFAFSQTGVQESMTEKSDEAMMEDDSMPGSDAMKQKLTQ
jgi:predicted negative regulator of RcsB-dependent stress response